MFQAHSTMVYNTNRVGNVLVIIFLFEIGGKKFLECQLHFLLVIQSVVTRDKIKTWRGHDVCSVGFKAKSP